MAGDEYNILFKEEVLFQSHLLTVVHVLNFISFYHFYCTLKTQPSPKVYYLMIRSPKYNRAKSQVTTSAGFSAGCCRSKKRYGVTSTRSSTEHAFYNPYFSCALGAPLFRWQTLSFNICFAITHSCLPELLHSLNLGAREPHHVNHQLWPPVSVEERRWNLLSHLSKIAS